ncbi:MAG: hypothetical protein Q8O67_02845 [Deltaproteobacteria bacterium]|nr:hypothetical protein [Deltaproteobacteria bacterium]
MNVAVIVVVALIAAAGGAPKAPSTPAANESAAFDPRLRAALRDYEELELERVITKVEELLFDTKVPTADRARALMLLGLTYAQLGEASTADAKLFEAFTLDVDAMVPVKVPKKVQRLIDGVRERVKGQPQTPKDPTTTTTAAPEVAAVAPGWWLAGGGGAAVATGIGAVALAFALQDCSGQPTTTQRSAVDLTNAANGSVATGAALAGVGVVVVAAGVLWALAPISPPPPP